MEGGKEAGMRGRSEEMARPGAGGEAPRQQCGLPARGDPLGPQEQ